MIFGFDGNIKGFQHIICELASNDESLKLTHKEVRAYARCLLKILPETGINFKIKPQIETMLVAISISGLPHYDRAFLAKQILKLIEDTEVDLLESVSGDDPGF